MKKATRNYLLGLLMFLLALFEVVPGFVLLLVLPRRGGYMGRQRISLESCVFVVQRYLA